MAISLNYTEKLMKIISILGCWKFSREDSSFEKSSSISTCICIL